MIEKNVGGYDRIVRALLAVVSAVLGAVFVSGAAGPGGATGTAAGVALLTVAAGLAFNVVTQRCIGNSLLGIDTCKAGD